MGRWPAGALVHCQVQSVRQVKRWLSIFSAATAVVLFVAIAVTCVRPPAGHCDFNLRMNELCCVLKGVNPFFVWNESISFPPYVSNLPKQEVPKGCTEQVNAYAPWEYAYMMPFAFVPRPVAWFAYCLLMTCATLVVALYSRSGDGALDMGLSTVPLVVVSYLLWSNASVGNFIVIVLTSSVLMAHALSRGRWVVAGVFWAFAMVKPQSALLFAVPLLMRGKVLTCMVAGATCLAASALPAALCHSSLWDMLLQGPAANAELFQGCGTWPKFLCGRFFGGEADIVFGLVVGAVLCAWMTWLLRREKNWLVYLMPAAICASCWIYTQAYSHAMGWFVMYAILSALLRNPRSKILWALFVVSVPVLSRAFLAWHGFCAFFGIEFPMSEYAFRCVDSLNSTLSLAIAAVYCLWHARHHVPEAQNMV